MNGIILAAGVGKRLHPITLEMPKALIPVGTRPLMEHVLLGFKAAGINKVGIVTGHMADKVESYFGDGKRLGIEIAYRRQPVPEGTARAMLLFRDFGEDGDFMLSYGDVLLADPANYAKFVAFHKRGGFDLSITCNEEADPCDGAAVYLDGDRVTRIIEKPPRGTSSTNLNSRGVYLFPPSFMETAAAIPASPRGEYEITSGIETALASGLSVGGFVVSGFNSDVGTHERLKEADEEMTRRARSGR